MDKKTERLAEIAGNPDETQIVSLQDLEELERLQLTEDKSDAPGGSPAPVKRRAVPLAVALGLLAALCLAAVLAAVLVHQGVRPAASASSGSQGSR